MKPVRGGLIFPKPGVLSQSPNVNISWSWYNEGQGLVQWTFTNNSSNQVSVILLRNGYYFGNAFWPVYLANPEFGTNWATQLTPLVDQGVTNNSPPTGIIQFTNINERIVAFIFTLGPNQTWSMLEGGFSSTFPPSNPSLYEVQLLNSGPYCVGYDQEQVTEWDLQTSTNYQGYAPNPNSFNTVLVQAPSNAPYVQLFPGDTASDGACSGQNPCVQQIINGIEQGNVTEIIDGIICLLSSYNISIEKIFERKFKI